MAQHFTSQLMSKITQPSSLNTTTRTLDYARPKKTTKLTLDLTGSTTKMYSDKYP